MCFVRNDSTGGRVGNRFEISREEKKRGSERIGGSQTAMRRNSSMYAIDVMPCLCGVCRS